MNSYDVEKVFKHHPPSADDAKCYELVREKAKELAVLIGNLCLESRELALARTNLEQCVFWANASIARHYGTAPTKTKVSPEASGRPSPRLARKFGPGDMVRLIDGSPSDMIVHSVTPTRVGCHWGEGDDKQAEFSPLRLILVSSANSVASGENIQRPAGTKEYPG